MDSKKPKLSVVVPTLNEENYIPNLMESLRNQTFKDFEVIVCDDKSEDRTVQIAVRYGARVIINNRVGEFKSRNIGAENAKGEIIVFTSADAILPKDVFIKTWKEFSRDRELVALFRPLFPYDGPFWSKLEYVFFYFIIKRLRAKFLNLVTGSSTFTAVRKFYFLKLGGYGDTMSADGPIGRDLSKFGKVKISFDMVVPISTRRIAKMGFFGFNKHFKHTIMVLFFPFIEKLKCYQSILDSTHKKHDRSKGGALM